MHAAPWDLQVLSSLTKDWAQALTVRVPSPNHWTAREFQGWHLKIKIISTYKLEFLCSPGGRRGERAREPAHSNWPELGRDEAWASCLPWSLPSLPSSFIFPFWYLRECEFAPQSRLLHVSICMHETCSWHVVWLFFSLSPPPPPPLFSLPSPFSFPLPLPCDRFWDCWYGRSSLERSTSGSLPLAGSCS